MLMTIAVERYIAIVSPLRHHALSTKRNALWVISFCWLYSIFVGSLPLAGWHLPVRTNLNIVSIISGNQSTDSSVTSGLLSSTGSGIMNYSCRFHTVVSASYVAFMYPGHFIPLWIIMVALYAQIYMRARGHHAKERLRRISKMSPHAACGSASGPRAHENWRALRVLAVLVGYFLFSWLPVVLWYGTMYRGFTVGDVRELDPILPYWFYSLGDNAGVWELGGQSDTLRIRESKHPKVFAGNSRTEQRKRKQKQCETGE